MDHERTRGPKTDCRVFVLNKHVLLTFLPRAKGTRKIMFRLVNLMSLACSAIAQSEIAVFETFHVAKGGGGLAHH